MKTNNKGLSLVEIIIVIAILSAVTGTLVYGVGMVAKKPVEECAQKIRSSIVETRVTGMGKLDTVLYIYMDGDRVMVDKKVSGNGTPIACGDSGVKVEYRITGETSYRSLGDISNPLILSFDRSSGAFQPLTAMGLTDKYCLEIKISIADEVHLLKLSQLTGKVSVEEL